MTPEHGRTHALSGLAEQHKLITEGNALNKASSAVEALRSGRQHTSPILQAPVLTAVASDHSQQDSYFLPAEGQDPLLEDLGFGIGRRQVQTQTPPHAMHPPAPDVALAKTSSDLLSPGSTHSSQPTLRGSKPPNFSNRQDGELLRSASEGLRPHFGHAATHARNNFGLGSQDLMADARFGRDDIDEPRLGEDLIGAGIFPQDDIAMDSFGLPLARQDPGQQVFEESPRRLQEGMQSGMQTSRGYMPEDEILYPAYGSQDGFNRLTMNTNHPDPRADRQPAAPYLARGNPRGRQGNHMNTQPILDEQMYSRSPLQAEARESMYNQMGALHMHRSASESYIRGNTYQPGLTREGSQHSHETGSGEYRARERATGMQEEVSYRAIPPSEQPRAAVAARMKETPDFAMIYAYLGSMFDPVCHMIDHVDVMNQMSTVDRETTNLILANCVHNLSIPEFSEHVLHTGLRTAGANYRNRTSAASGGSGYGLGSQGRHQTMHH